MLVQTQAENQADRNNYYDGEFDAAIGLPPKTYSGDYWQGYLNQVVKTGSTPF